ncbi:enoyl-CoA hydratase/isomerase family protein [Ilumatobacter sp.]|uniref:enoyl-CoA hydratase/isomerase family protein n=1 Tax=Ilumatobacter sp. TaxID=1967498 RepID=UPI003B526EC2
MTQTPTAGDGDYTEISYREEGHVGVVTIERPEARNALTHTTYAELGHAVESTTARCLVITGSGTAFCSGDDVKQIMVNMSRDESGDADGRDGSGGSTAEHRPRLTPTAGILLRTDVPIVAAVNGAAVGWGMELALMADLRVASGAARFGELFVKRGLCSDVAGLARLVELVGRERAAELLYTGRIIDAAEAERIGLVSRVVDPDELMETAMALAGEIAANPPLAVQALKRGLRRALDPDWDDLGRFVSSTLHDLFATADHREGVAAFLDKREPTYVGR